ncbi:helix-turn-helix transcriptional regulator [Cyanobacteria bacterium FACHB-63]|nr:helix-turn-helix transcriptional regulator [Cyanobacteria bacterium FACHB-63]
MTVKEKEKTEKVDASGLVKEMRSRLGLSQEAFAVKLGVNFTTVNRRERGHRQLSRLALKQIERWLQEQGDFGADLLKRHFLLKIETKSYESN